MPLKAPSDRVESFTLSMGAGNLPRCINTIPSIMTIVFLIMAHIVPNLIRYLFILSPNLFLSSAFQEVL